MVAENRELILDSDVSCSASPCLLGPSCLVVANLTGERGGAPSEVSVLLLVLSTSSPSQALLSLSCGVCLLTLQSNPLPLLCPGTSTSDQLSLSSASGLHSPIFIFKKSLQPKCDLANTISEFPTLRMTSSTFGLFPLLSSIVKSCYIYSCCAPFDVFII